MTHLMLTKEPIERRRKLINIHIEIFPRVFKIARNYKAMKKIRINQS